MLSSPSTILPRLSSILCSLPQPVHRQQDVACHRTSLMTTGVNKPEMERRKSRKGRKEANRRNLVDTRHTTKRPCRMRGEISKSRPSHAEMKSKKKLLPSLSSCGLLSPSNHATPSRTAVQQQLPLVPCHCQRPFSTLPETFRVKGSTWSAAAPVTPAVIAIHCLVSGRQRGDWRAEAAACGMGR